MKKVKSIGKKVMSGVLATSLLLTPVGANNYCFAAPKDVQQIIEEQKKANKVYIDSKESKIFLTLLFLSVAIIYCDQRPETFAPLCNSLKEGKEQITNFWAAHGDEITLEGKWIVENIKNIGYDIYFLIKLLCESAYNIGESAYYILDTIGFKNVFSAIGAGYVTKKLWNGTKWACNKVADWFKSEPKKEKSGVKKFDMSLIIKDDDSETNNNEAMIEAAYARIKNGY